MWRFRRVGLRWRRWRNLGRGIGRAGLAASLYACLAASTSQLLALSPTFDINNATGVALPNASGAPKGTAAITAAATCHTNGASSTTIQWAGNGFLAASIPTNGSAVLYLQTASGRQFSEITGYTANTVTVGNSFNIALASAVACAVGGTLNTLPARLWLDDKPGWRHEFVTNASPYTFTAGFGVQGTQTLSPGPGWAQYIGVSGPGGSTPTLDWTVNAQGFDRTDYSIFVNLNFTNSFAGVVTAAISDFEQDVAFVNCTFSDWSRIDDTGTSGFALINSYLDGVNVSDDTTTYGLLLGNYFFQPTGLCTGVAMRSYVVRNLCHDVQSATGCWRSLANNGPVHLDNTADDSCGSEGLGDANALVAIFMGHIIANATTGVQGGNRPENLQPLWGGSFLDSTVGTDYGTNAIARTVDRVGKSALFVDSANENWEPGTACVNGLQFPFHTLVFGAQTDGQGLPSTINIGSAGASQIEDGPGCENADFGYSQ